MSRQVILRVQDVRTRLSAACVAAGSQRRFARQAGVSEGYLSMVVRGKQEPGDAILFALGLREDRMSRGYVEAAR